MAVIKSGGSTDQLSINATSNAAVTTEYDPSGYNRSTKATFYISSNNTTSSATTAEPFVIVEGTDNKTLIIQRIIVSGITNASGPTYRSIKISKFSTPISLGGAANTNPTRVKNDQYSPSPLGPVMKLITGSPTGGDLTGLIACRRIMDQPAAAAAGRIPEIIFDFRSKNSENTGVYLRSVSEGIGIGWSAAVADTLSVTVEWTQESL